MQGGGHARTLRGVFAGFSLAAASCFRGHFVAKQKARGPVVWGCSLIPEVPTLEGRCAVLTPRSPEQEDSGGIVRRRSSVFRQNETWQQQFVVSRLAAAFESTWTAKHLPQMFLRWRYRRIT